MSLTDVEQFYRQLMVWAYFCGVDPSAPLDDCRFVAVSTSLLLFVGRR